MIVEKFQRVSRNKMLTVGGIAADKHGSARLAFIFSNSTYYVPADGYRSVRPNDIVYLFGHRFRNPTPVEMGAIYNSSYIHMRKGMVSMAIGGTTDTWKHPARHLMDFETFDAGNTVMVAVSRSHAADNRCAEGVKMVCCSRNIFYGEITASWGDDNLDGTNAPQFTLESERVAYEAVMVRVNEYLNKKYGMALDKWTGTSSIPPVPTPTKPSPWKVGQIDFGHGMQNVRDAAKLGHITLSTPHEPAVHFEYSAVQFKHVQDKNPTAIQIANVRFSDHIDHEGNRYPYKKIAQSMNLSKVMR